MDSSENISFTVFLFFSSLFLSVSSEACNPVDKEALHHFKQQITADPSHLLQSWNVSSDCCADWEGVSCDSSRRIVNVWSPGTFWGNGFPVDTYMTGSLSPYLGNLSNLQLLDLSSLTELQGPIPPEFGKLLNLTHLFLDSNKLEGSITVTFKYLVRLQKLYLDDNSLFGGVPDSVFGSLASLSELGVSSNQLSESIPNSIGKLPMLTRLDAHQNKFSGSIPDAIGELKNLEHLDLSANNLTGSIPQSIGNLSLLQLLYLNQNQISGSIPSEISGLFHFNSAGYQKTS